MLTRTVFIESVGRYSRLFSKQPLSIFAQFTERVPMVKGRLDAKASTATGYCWLVWEKATTEKPHLVWVPPCRKQQKKAGDYDSPGLVRMPKSGRGKSPAPAARSIKTIKQADLFVNAAV